MSEDDFARIFLVAEQTQDLAHLPKSASTQASFHLKGQRLRRLEDSIASLLPPFKIYSLSQDATLGFYDLVLDRWGEIARKVLTSHRIREIGGEQAVQEIEVVGET